jgi:hypothetical protein
MEYDNLDALYKILCLALILLVPLAPAWGLYKIAPTDKFLAKGNFSGFRINATGSAGIYIVLFAAIYSQTKPILAEIDTTRALTTQISQLQKKLPWTIKYNLKLMDTDRLHEIDQNEYARYVQVDSILCVPRALNLSSDFKTVQFYMDNQNVTDMGDTLKSQVLLNGYGTTSLIIAKNSTSVDAKSRTITFSPTIYKVTPRASQLKELNSHEISVLKINAGNTKPPVMAAQ